MAAGYRSLEAVWIGGASAPPAAPPTGGYRSLLAFWLGGGGGTTGVVVPPIPPVPPISASGGGTGRVRYPRDVFKFLDEKAKGNKLEVQLKSEEDEIIAIIISIEDSCF